MKKLIRKILLETENSKSNLNRLLEKFKMNFPEELRPKVDIIEKLSLIIFKTITLPLSFLILVLQGLLVLEPKTK